MSKKKIGQENREARNTFVYIEFDIDCKLCCCFFWGFFCMSCKTLRWGRDMSMIIKADVSF